MDDNLKFAVNEGSVGVNHAARIIDHDDVKIWMCDLDIKNAEIISTGSTHPENTYDVLVGYNNAPLDESPTGIRIAGLSGNWLVTAEISRYTLIIVVFAESGDELSLDYYKEKL